MMIENEEISASVMDVIDGENPPYPWKNGENPRTSGRIR